MQAALKKYAHPSYLFKNFQQISQKCFFSSTFKKLQKIKSSSSLQNCRREFFQNSFRYSCFRLFCPTERKSPQKHQLVSATLSNKIVPYLLSYTHPLRFILDSSKKEFTQTKNTLNGKPKQMTKTIKRYNKFHTL